MDENAYLPSLAKFDAPARLKSLTKKSMGKDDGFVALKHRHAINGRENQRKVKVE